VRSLIETHFGLALILACVLGLVLPGMPAIPNELAALALAVLMFVSCYRLRDSQLADVRPRELLMFYAVRYVALPPLLYGATLMIAPDYALAVLLLSVVPAAVSSPAFTAMYGGKITIAFAVVLLSQLMSPLLIPLQFMAVGADGVTPSTAHLFHTLLLCVVLPMALYALAKKHAGSSRYFYEQGKFISILLIMFIIALAVAKQREVILDNPLGLIIPFALAMGCYLIYFLVGFGFARRERAASISYATCSGFNNAALGVSLALLHFGPEVLLFIAAAEIGWSLLPMLMRVMLNRRA
jgi:predicted Na+-dependent transporter